MGRFTLSEKLLLEEIAEIAHQAKKAIRGLSIGEMIRMMRLNLGMSQKALANRAKVPQSTISRVEKGEREANLETLQKVLKALSCDLVILPMLHESIDSIRQNQARKIAKKRIQYLQGTMSLENQKPDARFVEELLKQEEYQLLHEPSKRLWEEE